jgi:tetratricopeptide (TPR) repeat protein
MERSQKTEARIQKKMGGRARLSFWILASGFWLLLFSPGCSSKAERAAEQAVQAYFAGDPARAVQQLKPLAQKPDQNFVLNNARLGSAALIQYDLDEAENAFLRAYEVLNSFGVNSGGRSLGAILVDEKIRVWRGEPFERAMLNFYLGLVYYMRQDYGNARGAFENALFKLRDYADEADRKKDDYTEVESNFALAAIMLGKSWQRLGRDNLARAAFDRVTRMRSSLAPLADYDRNLKSNLLLVIDFGYGPRKVTDFDGAITGFAPEPNQEGMIPPPAVMIDGHYVDVGGINQPPVDLLAVAQDRRWQSIDTIRTIKSVVGTGLIYGGAYEATRRNGNDGAALAMIAAGVLLKATSQADVRQWEMLPRTVFLLPLQVAPGRHDVTVDFPNAPGLRQTWRGLEVPAQGEATYYFRMQRWNSGPFDWPPPAVAQAQTQQ